ncbi:MAG TPA: hypothetical protein VHU80_15685, partial [Polyangiaceae bacterium]|nr:hypothetical protein [Polyangiaceae bacterium]
MGSRTTQARWVQHPGVIAVGFVLLAMAAYSRVLDGWFLSDDDMLGQVIPDGRHVAWAHVARVFHMDWGERGDWAPVRYYRPLVIVSQALDATLWGIRPFGYHLTNAVLHGINGFLLYRIARTLGAGSATALFAGAAFVAFPWCPESVAWISGRTDVLAATGTLSGLAFHLEARAATGRRRLRLIAGSLAGYSLGLLSKEAAFPLPLMVVGVDLVSGFERRALRRSVVRILPVWALFGAVAAGYLWLRSTALGNFWGGDQREFYGHRGSWSERLVENWTQNLRLLFTPYNREAVTGGGRTYAVACLLGGIAVAVGLGLAVLARASRPRLIIAGFVLLVASIAPFAVGIHVETNLDNARLLYLFTAFFCLLLASVLAPAWERPSSLAPAGALLALLTALLMKNLTPWVEASDIMRRITKTYEDAFGTYSGEGIEDLPQKHHGAYMALYNAATMARPFILAPPKLDAVAAKRAVYDRRAGDVRVVPDPVG